MQHPLSVGARGSASAAAETAFRSRRIRLPIGPSSENAGELGEWVFGSALAKPVAPDEDGDLPIALRKRRCDYAAENERRCVVVYDFK
jgi:hypothetical protein